MMGSFIKQKIATVRFNRYLNKIYTELDEAVPEITRRREDPGLMREVESFLEKDVPGHFAQKNPVFYLSRYLASPDYETLFYIDQVKKYNFPIVIGEDGDDILTSHSSLKRNLIKLPIIVGESKNGDGIIEYKRIADLNSEQGKKLRDVRLLNGDHLIDFHHNLAQKFLPKNVLVVNESDWVNRHARGDLVSLYECVLALLIVHGVMLEFYEVEELDFLAETVYPAFVKTKKRFGHLPLIAPLHQTHAHARKIKDSNSYPHSVKKYIDTVYTIPDTSTP